MSRRNRNRAKERANAVFLACNFNNERVKQHFVALKEKWERTFPIDVYLSDMFRKGGARDLWAHIKEHIEGASLAIFDVTSFRPNVVLELGYALALKQEHQIIICRDTTPNGKVKAGKTWALSDIAHLYRCDYKTFKTLDNELNEHVGDLTAVINFYRLADAIEGMKKTKKTKGLLIAVALDVLKMLRDEGPIARGDFSQRISRRKVDGDVVERLLVRYNLAKPGAGRSGKWALIADA